VNYNRFLVDYIDVKQLHVNANYSRTINNIISLNANADYYKWDKEVYHKSNFTANISAPINLRNKIKVTPSLSYMSERTSSLKFYVDDVTNKPPEITPLNSQFHANLDLYYSYSKQLSTYLQLNNLTNSKQDLWRDYREVGRNVVFGLNYSF
jgi:outer membrane receptor protein involved in Fe transport